MDQIATYRTQQGGKWGLCDHPTSINHGLITTHEKCFHENYQVDGHVAADVGNYEEKPIPKIEPTRDGSTLVADNPGIWMYHYFVNEEEIKHLLQLVKKYGEDYNMFGPCKHEESGKGNAHPTKNESCFKISVDHVCDGPNDVSKCEMKTEKKMLSF